MNDLPRRQFLKLSGIAGGGLVLGLLPGCGGDDADADAPETSAGNGERLFTPNAFLQISSAGAIVIVAPVPEVGQGVKTSLPMIVAEELDVPWDSVVVRQAEFDEKYCWGDRKNRWQNVRASLATPKHWDGLCKAGATARAMLITAAAQSWGVDESDCDADQGFVVTVKDGERLKLSYAKLATRAAELPVPAEGSVTLKARGDYKLLGKRIPGVDNLAIVTGKPLYGIDQQLPGMLYAVYLKCPRCGGGVKDVNLDELRKLPGVVDAFVLDGNGDPEQLMPGLAIVARSTREAFEAQDKVDPQEEVEAQEKALITWDYESASDDSWSKIEAEARLKAEQPGNIKKGHEKDHERGDTGAAISGADKVVEAFYVYPFLAHATLEPQNCTAWFHGGKLELWAPTQEPDRIPGMLKALLGIEKEDLVIHPVRMGGGFGRRGHNDFVCEAAAIARKVDSPVKLMWTREADIQHDHYRVGGFHKLVGALDPAGKLTGLLDHFIVPVPQPDPQKEVNPLFYSWQGGDLKPRDFQCPELPNLRIETTAIRHGVPAGFWRAPGSNAFAWVTQSFLHEMSVAAGRDHVEFLLEQLGKPRWLDEGNKDKGWNLHTGRAIEVIKAAAKHGNWGDPMEEGRGRGLSFYFSHQGYFAEVAEVTVRENTQVKVDRVVVAVDVGLIINRSGAEHQVEGSVIDGLSALASQEVKFEGGEVKVSNFHNYPLLRIGAQPTKIDVHFLESKHNPTGLGEPAFPPLAPAVCNAIYDATETRIRTMPISKKGFNIV